MKLNLREFFGKRIDTAMSRFSATTPRRKVQNIKPGSGCTKTSAKTDPN